MDTFSISYWKCFWLFIIVGLLGSLLTPTALAWQVSIPYGHNNRFGGEADSGWHRGQIEVNANRYVRAGDDHVKWQQPQIDWWNMNGGPSDRPAMVYHAFNGHGSNDNGCGDIRIANAGWSWSNLPNWQTFTKKAGCLTGNDNEIRFLIYGYQNLVAGQNYYFQHAFYDEKWMSSGGTQRGIGKVTVDTYHDGDRWYGNHIGISKDYHGVFCIPNNNDVVFLC